MTLVEIKLICELYGCSLKGISVHACAPQPRRRPFTAISHYTPDLTIVFWH